MQAFPRDEPDARPEGIPAPNPPRYWFPAKRYGWGWGLPVERPRPAPACFQWPCNRASPPRRVYSPSKRRFRLILWGTVELPVFISQ